eukprot:8747074-Lingulodinium_polyedra.AAC.1
MLLGNIAIQCNPTDGMIETFGCVGINHQQRISSRNDGGAQSCDLQRPGWGKSRRWGSRGINTA